MTETASDTVRPPPPPPRLTGDPQQDMLIVAAHLNEIYQNTFVNYQVTKTVTGYDPAGFDPASLPDPASTTLGKAQRTANDAYALANSAKSDAASVKETADDAKATADTAEATANTANNKTKDWLWGNFTISGTNNTATMTFGEPQADAIYWVVVSVKDYSGSPPPEALVAIRHAYTTTTFTVTINAAPGAGNSVTFNWLLVR